MSETKAAAQRAVVGQRCAVPLICALLLCLLPAGAAAQTSSIPLETLPSAPTSGTLPNGVGFAVNIGAWYDPAPNNVQGYIFYPPQSPQIWTFDVPVSLRFGLRGLNITGECFRVPVGTVAEFIHPNHSWNPATRMVCRAANTPNSESIFTIAGPVTELVLEAINASSGGRGPGFIEVTVNAGIGLDKTATGPDPLTLGATINYSFLVTNTGNVVLSNVSVGDPLPGLSPISCPGTTLSAGASMTCTASYTVTQADVDNGSVSNTATATGTPPGSVPPVSAQDSTTMPPTQSRRIQLDKSAGAPAPNGVVTYSFQVTNTGNVTLSSVTVTDPLPGLSAISCPATTLASAASMTCTATYTLTQANIDAGSVTNTATASGTPPSAPVVTDQDSATVNTSQAARIDLSKTAAGPDPLTVGSTVSYTFLVTNIGQLNLAGVTVTDPMPGLSAISCPGTTLAPSASMTCTASYTVTQADVNAGRIDNTATALGTPPNGLSAVSAQDATTTPQSQLSRINLRKTASGPSANRVVAYSFQVTNTGTGALSSVTVTDPLPGLSAVACPGTTLAPGASMTCTATYTLTQADINAGFVTNTATATGAPPEGPPVTDQDSATVNTSVPVPTVPQGVLILLLMLLSAGALLRLRRAGPSA